MYTQDRNLSFFFFVLYVYMSGLKSMLLVTERVVNIWMNLIFKYCIVFLCNKRMLFSNGIIRVIIGGILSLEI